MLELTDVAGVFDRIDPGPDGSAEAQLAHRANWFRVEEREKKNSRAYLSVEQTVVFSRIIVRAGYFLEPNDMPDELALENAFEITAKDANGAWRYAPAERRVFKPGDLIPGLGIDLVAVKAVVAALCGSEWQKFRILRHPLRMTRSNWLADMKGEFSRLGCAQPLDLRTFWYVDLGYEAIGQIARIKNRWIGEYAPGCPANSSFDGDYDPIPPGLNTWSHHQLYEVCGIGLGAVLVHPDDVKLVTHG